MKTFKKALAVVMCVVMTLTASPFSGLVGLELPSLFDFNAEAATISSYSQGDIIKFGWYPQSEVTDSTTIASLNAVGGEWISYRYYSGMGTSEDGKMDDGKMIAGDYMRYKDVVYGSDKYRAVVFDTYRPYYTGYQTNSSSSYSEQYINGYKKGNVYWFKYEPVKWRVLDPDKGMVLSETIIDCQAYNNYVLKIGEYSSKVYWGDSSKTYYANNYAESSIREWLNDDFYNTAFSTAQQNIIEYTSLDNSAYSDYYSAYASAATNDKIYLLSYDDASDRDYGFAYAPSTQTTVRRAQGSDYAKCQGLRISRISSSQDKSTWLLRTPGSSSNYVCDVDCDGTVSCLITTYSSSNGIRPALNFNLTSEIFQSDVKDTCEHIPGEWEIKTKPTCTEDGIGVKKCTECQTELETQPIEVLGHTKGEWEYIGGFSGMEYVYFCTVCGKEIETRLFNFNIFLDGENVSEKQLLNKSTAKITALILDNIPKELIFASSDSSIVFVDANGNLVANDVGKATITVTINGTAISDSIEVEVLPRDFTITWNVNGKQTKQTVKEYAAFTPNVNTTRQGYKFIGWDKTVPSKMPAENLTFTAQYGLIVKQLKVKNPSTSTINYGETLVMHADFGGVELPEGWKVEWTVEGAGFNMAPAADGLTCKMTSVANGNATVKATLVDENGEAVLDEDGNEMSDSKNLTSKAGFWQKFVSFFKNLFGISRIILQSK